MTTEKIVATVDDVRFTSGDADVDLSDIVGVVLDFMRARGVADFRVEITSDTA